jgi:hypothetical protein
VLHAYLQMGRCLWLQRRARLRFCAGFLRCRSLRLRGVGGGCGSEVKLKFNDVL